MAQISRRNLLKGSAAAAGASVFTFSQMFGYSRVFGQSGGDDPQTILNLAATAETFACVHYYNTIMSAEALQLTAEEVSWLKQFLDSELKHKQFLEANGAQALATEFFVPENLFSDRTLWVNTTDTAENWFIAAYLAATRRFAELGEPLLAATASQVSGVEAEHKALIRVMGNLLPSNLSLMRPLFFNTSEVVPLFTPFLEGGDGFVGPAAFPGVNEINALVGDEGVQNITPFIQLNGQGTMSMTPEASADAGMACMVSATNTNVRSGPGTDFEVTGSLNSNTQTSVTGQSTDVNGFTWYQVEGGWVRADVVTAAGDCTAVPAVSS